MIEKDLSIGIIVQHNVPDFICWKYEESPLLTVYSHCDRVIALALIQLHSNPLSLTMDTIIMLLFQIHSSPLSSTMNAIIIFQLLHSNPLSSTMNAIIVIISDPFKPFEFDDECDCCILVVEFEPFEFNYFGSIRAL